VPPLQRQVDDRAPVGEGKKASALGGRNKKIGLESLWSFGSKNKVTMCQIFGAFSQIKNEIVSEEITKHQKIAYNATQSGQITQNNIWYSKFCGGTYFVRTFEL